MTIDYKNLTESQESDYRNKVFYLLKKYTSYTFLDHARTQYQAFLRAFAAQLNNPGLIDAGMDPDVQRWVNANFADGTYENYYRECLKEMIPIEEGLKLLRNTPHKTEAYRAILSNQFTDLLWGRGADERSIEHDPFFIALGLRTHTYDYANQRTVPAKHEDHVLQMDLALDSFYALKRTSSEYDWWLKDRKRVAYHWTYESFFDNYAAYGRSWPPISCPPILPPCSSKNLSPEGQILSGEEIPITGIWEPWYITPPSKEGVFSGLLDRLSGKSSVQEAPTVTGKVGCPNYFLAGTTAFKYETDGTGDKVKVAWRLLWEDTRYLDGTIPEEESTYFEPQAPAPEQRPAVLTAYPGDPCPESGEWYSVNLNDRRVVMKQGEPMPGPKYSAVGVVVWHLKKDAS